MNHVKKSFFNIVILALSALDYVFLGWLWEGLLIVGGPGSGKSSCVGRSVALGMLKGVPELGALILTAKSSETETWLRYAKEAGREQDVILFNSENGCFDPLHYEWTRKGRGAGDLESIIDLLHPCFAFQARWRPFTGLFLGAGL